MQSPPPTHPAVLELTRVRQIHAQRHLHQAAGLLDALADVIQLAREGDDNARQLLLRLRQLPAEIEAASSGLQVVRGPVKG